MSPPAHAKIKPDASCLRDLGGFQHLFTFQAPDIRPHLPSINNSSTVTPPIHNKTDDWIMAIACGLHNVRVSFRYPVETLNLLDLI